MIYPDQAQGPADIANHYDSLDKWYRKLWGEHVHHGYWKSGKETPEQAVLQLSELVANQIHIAPGAAICDIGCGYGGTTKLFSNRWKAKMTGFSLSAKQIEYARSEDPDSTYFLKDWSENGLPSKSFDAAISIESSEHMVDKAKFFEEIARILRPGGRVAVCAWLSKENPRPWEIRYLLEPICREGRLPSLGTVSEYRNMMERVGFKQIVFEDLSRSVRKTWAICGWRVMQSLKSPEFRTFLFKERPADRIFAKTIFRILTAYWTKSMVYGIFSATR